MEDPLDEGGHWLRAGTDIWELDMRKTVNTLAGDQSHPTSLSGHIAGSYWTAGRFYDDCEVWGIPVGGQLGAALETWRLFIFETPWTAPSGYLVYVGGGLSKDTVIRRYDAGDFTNLVSSTAGYASALELRINGDDVECWACDFGHSPGVPSNWYLRCSVTDTTYRGPFYVGMAIEDPSNGGLAWKGIGGGKRKRQQIYRYVKPPRTSGTELTP